MTSPPTLRIAIAQTTIDADPRANGRTVRRLMREAAEGGARLVQFPEGCLSGYAKEQHADWEQLDWTVVDEEHRAVATLAAELRLWVVLGSTHRLTPPHRPHNSLYVISDEGEVVGRYDKRYISHTEVNRYYAPGFEATTFDVDGFRFGCVICVEINFPELFAEYERAGVDCLLLSAYPVDAIFEVKARAHAAINGYWVAMSTPTQTAHLMNSELIAPEGTVLGRANGGEELVFGELDRGAYGGILGLVRPWRASARDGEIYRTRKVDDPRSVARTGF